MADHAYEIRFPEAAFIHPTALLYGGIRLAHGCSLWPYVVIRAEAFEVRIGRFTNIQDLVMIHIGYETPTVVGDFCSITHRVTLHGCTVGDSCLIGIGATLMDRVVVGENSIVAAHTVLTEGTEIPPNSIVIGAPGKVVRERNNFVANRVNAMLYHRNAIAYRRGEHRAWTGPEHAAHVRQLEEEFTAELAAQQAEGGN